MAILFQSNSSVMQNSSAIQNNDKNPENNSLESNPERELSFGAQELLKVYKNELEKEASGVNQPTIKVSEVLESVAFIYERIRNAIDYKGEHLLRRNAIERIIKRQIWTNSSKSLKEISQTLIRELIWARYLKNDNLPQNKIEEVTKILTKYFSLLEPKSSPEWRNWLIGIASCEIEEALTPLFQIEAYSQAMYWWFKTNFDWQDNNLTPQEKDLQIFLAIYRALPKSDETMLRYWLLRLSWPDWEKTTPEFIAETKNNLFKIHQSIEKQLNHPVKYPLFRFIRKHTAPFLILQQIADENPTKIKEIFVDPKKLEGKIREVCQRKYAQIRQKVRRGIIRSIIYIFVTKILLAFLIEIPYELFWLGSLNLIPISLNALVPPTLMFLVGLTIKTPDERNTRKIIEQIESFIYLKKTEEKTSFSLFPVKRNRLVDKVFSVIYKILFLLTFGGIALILFKLKFNLISAGIFFVFLSLVLLFGFRVRFTASELIVTGEKENFLTHLLDNISLPFLNLGVWLSKGLAQFSVLMILMDFLIETPLKNIITTVGEWTNFIKERKEKVVEVPIHS